MLWGSRPLQRGFLLAVGPSPGWEVEMFAGLGGDVRRTPVPTVSNLWCQQLVRRVAIMLVLMILCFRAGIGFAMSHTIDINGILVAASALQAQSPSTKPPVLSFYRVFHIPRPYLSESNSRFLHFSFMTTGALVNFDGDLRTRKARRMR